MLLCDCSSQLLLIVNNVCCSSPSLEITKSGAQGRAGTFLASSEGWGEAVGALRLLPGLSEGCCRGSGVWDLLLGLACTSLSK